MDSMIHPSACVDAGAIVGPGARIWHFCHVMGGAELGESCSLGQNVFVARNVKIGNHVKIQNNVSIYEGVTLEDYVFCGPSMVFTNVRTPRSAYPRNSSSDYHPTRVCYGATLGANCTIVCGVTIGRWAFVGAGSVVTRDVPEHAVLTGVPGRITGWACECGMGIKFTGELGTCSACGKSYDKIGPTKVERHRQD